MAEWSWLLRRLRRPLLRIIMLRRYYGDQDREVLVQLRPRHVVASLDKTRYDAYLCFVELKQAANYWTSLQATTGKLGNWMWVRIRPKYSTAVAFQ